MTDGTCVQPPQHACDGPRLQGITAAVTVCAFTAGRWQFRATLRMHHARTTVKGSGGRQVESQRAVFLAVRGAQVGARAGASVRKDHDLHTHHVLPPIASVTALCALLLFFRSSARPLAQDRAAPCVGTRQAQSPQPRMSAVPLRDTARAVPAAPRLVSARCARQVGGRTAKTYCNFLVVSQTRRCRIEPCSP